MRERRRDGRVRHRHLRPDRTPTRSSTRTRSRTTGSGRASTRCRRTSSPRPSGPSLPEPLLLHRGHARAGRSDNPENIPRSAWRTARASRAGAATRSATTSSSSSRDDDGNLTKHDTCFEFPTVGEQLTDAGVDWAFYSAVAGAAGLLLERLQRRSATCSTRISGTSTCGPSTRLLDDIDANALPAVTWVTPAVPALRPPSVLHAATRTTGSGDREQR